MKRAGSTLNVQWLRIQPDISAAKFPPGEPELLTPNQSPLPRVPELGSGAYITPGCENQRRFCPPGRSGIC